MSDMATRFASDVAEHQVSVLLDRGVYRHLRCRRPGTYCMGFDIVTYPGHLCYSGDMGTYVFARLPDMFEFFRHDRPNFSYWAEKVESGNKLCGVRQFSEDLFIVALKGDIASLREDLDADDQRELDAEIEDAGLFYDISPDSVGRVMEFEWRREKPFHDFYDHRLEDYTHHFQWCCHALVWAIKRYDEQESVGMTGRCDAPTATKCPFGGAR